MFHSRRKTRSFPVSLHANVFVEASICRLVSRFTTGTQNYCQSDWSFLFLPSLFWGCLVTQINDSYLSSQSLWMFSEWLVFTSSLNSQTTWLTVKLKLVVCLVYTVAVRSQFKHHNCSNTSCKSPVNPVSELLWSHRGQPVVCMEYAVAIRSQSTHRIQLRLCHEYLVRSSLSA